MSFPNKRILTKCFRLDFAVTEPYINLIGRVFEAVALPFFFGIQREILTMKVVLTGMLLSVTDLVFYFSYKRSQSRESLYHLDISVYNGAAGDGTSRLLTRSTSVTI